MAKKITSATKLVIPCRISFANIFEPKSINGSEAKYSVSDLTDPVDSFYQSSGGKELWIYSNGSASGSGSHSFYRTNGGIFY